MVIINPDNQRNPRLSFEFLPALCVSVVEIHFFLKAGKVLGNSVLTGAGVLSNVLKASLTVRAGER